MNIRHFFLIYFLMILTANCEPYCCNLGMKDGTVKGFVIAGYDISYTKDKKKIIKALCYSNDQVIRAYTVDDFRADQAKIYAINVESNAISSRSRMIKLMKTLNHVGQNSSPFTKGYGAIYGKEAPDITITGWMGAKSAKPLNKATFPNFQRKDLGLKDGYSTQMALVNILYYWEKNGLIKFPNMSSEKKKLQALYKIVNTKQSSSLSKANWQNISSSLFKMTAKTLKGEYAIIPFHHSYQNSYTKSGYEQLKKLVKSPYHSACLGISLLDKDYKSVGSQAINVLAVNGDKLELQAWGIRFQAKIAQLEFIKSNQLNQEHYTELEVINPDILPQWIKDKNLKLAFKDNADGIYYFQLMHKVKAGMTWQQPSYVGEVKK